MWETTTLGSIMNQEPLNEIYLNAEAIKEALAESDDNPHIKQTVFGKPFANVTRGGVWGFIYKE